MSHGPFVRCVKLFSSPPRVSDPDMHHGTCVAQVSWNKPVLLTNGFVWSQWRGKRPRHSRRMRNRNFTYLARHPYIVLYFILSVRVGESIKWSFATPDAVGNSFICRNILICYKIISDHCRATIRDRNSVNKNNISNDSSHSQEYVWR